MAKKYNGKGVPMGDLISEGNMGLIRAIEKFDLSRNVRFSVCAYWWIESAMIEFCKKQTLFLYISVHVANKLPKENVSKCVVFCIIHCISQPAASEKSAFPGCALYQNYLLSADHLFRMEHPVKVRF